MKCNMGYGIILLCVQFIAGLFKQDGGQEGGGASSRRRAPTIASRFSESLDKLITAMSR